jgi:putative metallopeptidase DUF4344
LLAIMNDGRIGRTALQPGAAAMEAFRIDDDRVRGRAARLAWFVAALLALVGLRAEPLSAQQSLPAAAQALQARIEETSRVLAEREPKLKRLAPEKRQALIEFVIGNMLFVAAHELGHGVLAELQLPNLGRDEDAADSFAILTAIKAGNSFSHRILVEAAKGWYLADLRDKKTGEKPAYYDSHSMNLQRAYQIVCLMVGSDPIKFKELAELTELPDERQESCKGDFSTVEWSWGTLLKPHLRTLDQPRQEIKVTYGEGKGRLGLFARSFQDIKFLETLADFVGERYKWPNPIAMEMESCGEAGANWRSRKLRVCYEMAQEFVELYRDYGGKLKKAPRSSKPKVSKRKKKKNA